MITLGNLLQGCLSEVIAFVYMYFLFVGGLDAGFERYRLHKLLVGVEHEKPSARPDTSLEDIEI